MTMAERNINRNIQIFKDYLEEESFEVVGNAHGLKVDATRVAVRQIRASVLRMVVRDELPLPKGKNYADLSKEKSYWVDMIKTYELYVEEESHIGIDSPVRKLKINGMAISKLNDLNVFTIADLLHALKEDKKIMEEKFKYFWPNVKIFEKKLTDLGLDPQAGREQQITQQQGE